MPTLLPIFGSPYFVFVTDFGLGLIIIAGLVFCVLEASGVMRWEGLLFWSSLSSLSHVVLSFTRLCLTSTDLDDAA